MQSRQRITVPIVLASTPLLLGYSVVDSPVLSLLIGRDAIENLGIDIFGSRKALRLGSEEQALEDSVAGHYCVPLSPERYLGLDRIRNGKPPPTSRLRERNTTMKRPRQGQGSMQRILGVLAV